MIVTNTRSEWETVPKYVPSAGEDVYTSDTHIVEIHLINTSGSTVTITINDKQGTPQAVIPPAISLASGTDMIWEFTGRLCPGGVHWSASVDNAVTGYMRGRI